GLAVAFFFGNISSRVKRLFIRSKEYIQRPSAPAGKHLANQHIGIIDIRAFLTVDFDINKVLVHEFSNSVILKGFPSHYAAPVASGITASQENRFVFLPCLRLGLLSPGLSVNRIVGTLEHVGPALLFQSIVGCSSDSHYSLK